VIFDFQYKVKRDTSSYTCSTLHMFEKKNYEDLSHKVFWSNLTALHCIKVILTQM